MERKYVKIYIFFSKSQKVKGQVLCHPTSLLDKRIDKIKTLTKESADFWLKIHILSILMSKRDVR